MGLGVADIDVVHGAGYGIDRTVVTEMADPPQAFDVGSVVRAASAPVRRPPPPCARTNAAASRVTLVGRRGQAPRKRRPRGAAPALA
jgi:hypothetical protein